MRCKPSKPTGQAIKRGESSRASAYPAQNRRWNELVGFAFEAPLATDGDGVLPRTTEWGISHGNENLFEINVTRAKTR